MISNVARNEVWHNMLDVNRMCRYYESIHSKNIRRHFITRSLTLVLISGVIAALLDIVPFIEGFVPTAVIAIPAVILTIWDALANYSKKASVAHVCMTQSVKLRFRLQDIWLDVENDLIEENELRTKIKDYALEMSEIDGLAGANDLQVDKKVNQKTTEDAYAFVEARYGVRT